MDAESTLDSLVASYSMGATWESWDFPRTFECACGAGPVTADRRRAADELRAGGHSQECARRVAAAMRKFESRVEELAEAAEECGEAAIMAAEEGDWTQVRDLAKEAADIERKVNPDAPSWGRLEQEAEEALELAVSGGWRSE
jgi:hypothetical protein